MCRERTWTKDHRRHLAVDLWEDTFCPSDEADAHWVIAVAFDLNRLPCENLKRQPDVVNRIGKHVELQHVGKRLSRCMNCLSSQFRPDKLDSAENSAWIMSVLWTTQVLHNPPDFFDDNIRSVPDNMVTTVGQISVAMIS